MNQTIPFLLCLLCAQEVLADATQTTGSTQPKPNFIVILADDLGYGDLNPDEQTLPELLKAQGYATAIIGKWHLGNQDIFQPLRHGFDYWYGTPSSNSQGFYPTLKQYAPDRTRREGYTLKCIP